MNLFTRTLGALTTAWRTVTSQQNQSIAKGAGSHQVTASLLMQASRGGISHGNGDLNYFMRLAVTNPWWYAANRTIANRISDTAKFRVEEKRKGEWVDDPTHAFLSVLERPNSMMTGGMLLGATAEWMNAAGNGYWFAVTDTPGVGPIRELWPLPADKVEPDPLRLRISPFTGATVIDYRYNLGGVTWLPGENVIHFRASNLFDYWRGAAPLSALQTILPTDLAQTNWLGSFFGENNAVPTAVISLPPETSDADFDVIKRDIVEQFGAQRRAAITRAGDMSVEAIQQTIEEMQVINGMEFNAKAIRAVLGVPKRDDLPSGQSQLAAEMALMRDAVQPMLNLFAQWMTLKVMPFYEERPGTLRVVAENVVPQDSAIAVAEYGAFGLDRTLNENRKEQKLEPLKLTGPLAPMQPLFDQVPQRYVELFAPIVQQATQAAQKPAAGAGGDDAALVAQMAGQRALPGPVGGDNQLVAAMAGSNGNPKPQPQAPGVRTTGIERPDDLVAAMAGGALKAMKGGRGSGNFGHAGRPGEVGGSAPQKKTGVPKDEAAMQRVRSALMNVALERMSAKDLAPILRDAGIDTFDDLMAEMRAISRHAPVFKNSDLLAILQSVEIQDADPSTALEFVMRAQDDEIAALLAPALAKVKTSNLIGIYADLYEMGKGDIPSGVLFKPFDGEYSANIVSSLLKKQGSHDWDDVLNGLKRLSVLPEGRSREMGIRAALYPLFSSAEASGDRLRQVSETGIPLDVIDESWFGGVFGDELPQKWDDLRDLFPDGSGGDRLDDLPVSAFLSLSDYDFDFNSMTDEDIFANAKRMEIANNLHEFLSDDVGFYGRFNRVTMQSVGYDSGRFFADPQSTKALSDAIGSPLDDPNFGPKEQKAEIVSALSRMSGTPEVSANLMLAYWAEGSNEDHMSSMGIQESAAEIFGVDLSPWQANKIKRVSVPNPASPNRDLYTFENNKVDRAEAKAKVKTILSSMYEYTQQWFKDRGITHVKLYRGTSRSEVSPLPGNTVVRFNDNALASWSASKTVARGFGSGVVLSAVVPVSRIIGSCKTGFGCWDEQEFVVIGGMEDAYAKVE